MRIAFLGLGHMGLPMAKNLAATGHEVVGFDVAPAAVAAAGEAGLATADSGTDAATGADVVITMFQTGAQVLDAYRGAGGEPGLLEVAASGALFIDCSTIAVDEARAAPALAEEAGRRSLDAPVSGGVVGTGPGTGQFVVSAQHCPDALDATSNSAWCESPSRSPSTNASATAICDTARIMLLHTLAACPRPAPPQCTTRRPIASSSGRAASKSSSVPPTMKASVAFSAPTTPPETGASTLRCPAASASA